MKYIYYVIVFNRSTRFLTDNHNKDIRYLKIKIRMTEYCAYWQRPAPRPRRPRAPRTLRPRTASPRRALRYVSNRSL